MEGIGMKQTWKVFLLLSLLVMVFLQGCGSQKKEDASFQPKYDRDTEFSLTGKKSEELNEELKPDMQN